MCCWPSPLSSTVHFHKVQHKDCTVHLECNFCHLVNIVLLLAHTVRGSQNMGIILFALSLSRALSSLFLCPCLTRACANAVHTQRSCWFNRYVQICFVKLCSSNSISGTCLGGKKPSVVPTAFCWIDFVYFFYFKLFGSICLVGEWVCLLEWILGNILVTICNDYIYNIYNLWCIVT